MRKFFLMMVIAMTATIATAKDIRTLIVTTTPQMHCQKCENRVKTNLKDVKGVKSVETSVADQTVTIQYDAKKTSEEQLIKAFEGFKMNARKLAPGETVVREEHQCKGEGGGE